MAAPVKAFNPFPVVKQAYTNVRDRLHVIILEQNRPELGLIDVPLWLYIHSCVPERFELPSLKSASSGIGPRCKGMVIPLLASGQLDPSEFAASIQDSARLDKFVDAWIRRPLTGRVSAKKRAQRAGQDMSPDLPA